MFDPLRGAKLWGEFFYAKVKHILGCDINFFEISTLKGRILGCFTPGRSKKWGFFAWKSNYLSTRFSQAIIHQIWPFWGALWFFYFFYFFFTKGAFLRVFLPLRGGAKRGDEKKFSQNQSNCPYTSNEPSWIKIRPYQNQTIFGCTINFFYIWTDRKTDGVTYRTA